MCILVASACPLHWQLLLLLGTLPWELLFTVWSRCLKLTESTLLMVRGLSFVLSVYHTPYLKVARCQVLSWRSSFQQLPYYPCVILLDMIGTLTQLRRFVHTCTLGLPHVVNTQGIADCSESVPPSAADASQ